MLFKGPNKMADIVKPGIKAYICNAVICMVQKLLCYGNPLKQNIGLDGVPGNFLEKVA